MSDGVWLRTVQCRKCGEPFETHSRYSQSCCTRCWSVIYRQERLISAQLRGAYPALTGRALGLIVRNVVRRPGRQIRGLTAAAVAAEVAAMSDAEIMGWPQMGPKILASIRESMPRLDKPGEGMPCPTCGHPVQAPS